MDKIHILYVVVFDSASLSTSQKIFLFAEIFFERHSWGSTVETLQTAVEDVSWINEDFDEKWSERFKMFRFVFPKMITFLSRKPQILSQEQNEKLQQEMLRDNY